MERLGELPKITQSVNSERGPKHKWSGSRAHLFNSCTLLPLLNTAGWHYYYYSKNKVILGPYLCIIYAFADSTSIC